MAGHEETAITCEQARRLLSSHFDRQTKAERGVAFAHVNSCGACTVWFCEGDPEKSRVMEAMSRGNPLPALAYLSRRPQEELKRYLDEGKE